MTSASAQCAMCIRDLQCCKLDGNQTDIDRYSQIRFLLFVNVLKMFRFLCIGVHLKFAKSVNITVFSLSNKSVWVSKNEEFLEVV